MIKSFRHKGLKLLWEKGYRGRLPYSHAERLRDMLEVIDSAQQVPQDFELFRSWKVHPLKGEYKGCWSLTVKENWRIVFRFDGIDAYDLDYLDYH